MYIVLTYCVLKPRSFASTLYSILMRSLSVQAQERKEALRKIPEQFILSEVRRMVEEMQNLNKKIDEIVSTEILDAFILFYWTVGSL